MPRWAAAFLFFAPATPELIDVRGDVAGVHDPVIAREGDAYFVVVGRSREITGPYLDAAGRSLMEGGGTRVTTATEKWRGPGHEGILLQPAGPDLMVYHAYDGATGRSALRISTLAWADGWPRAAPEQ